MKVLKHLSTIAFVLASCGFVSSVAAAVNVGATARVQFSTFLSTTTDEGTIRNWEATIYR